MARALTLGNGKLLVCLDEYGFVRDFYFPYVGLENQVSGEKHKIGVWVDGVFSWLDDGTWNITIGYKPETMVGYLVCKNEGWGITLVMEDCVYNEECLFVRQVDVYNHQEKERSVRIFFHQIFYIQESRKRNTAFFDPTHTAVVHYKGRRVFVVNGMTETGAPLDEYSVGAYQYEGKEGVYKDAEDGSLSNNAVEHGSVDSVIRFSCQVGPKAKFRLYYWIAASKSLEESFALNTLITTKTPAAVLHSTESYWHAWLKTKSFDISALSETEQKLFYTSLFVLRCHMDSHGSVIASADSAMIEYGKDDYSYMWPRDAAFIIGTLCGAGFAEVTKPFFTFCKNVLHPDGYLHHRFRPDESLGSTWHSTTTQREWLRDKILQLPIQEDESASVLVALWKYYEASKDLEFIEELYKPLIEKIAQFLVHFRDTTTGLPLPSYDLWEEQFGVSTYTCSAVYAGLQAAARFSEVLDKRNHMREYKQAAEEIKQAAIDNLFSKSLDSFVRSASLSEGKVEQLEQIDSSTLFGLWYFGMLPQDHPLFVKTLRQVQVRLQNPGPAGGYIRYERDNYFKSKDLSNPWIITTLWEVERRLLQPVVSDADFAYAEDIFAWVQKHQYLSGVLAEQLDPYTGASLSATPLVWSHAVYVETVLLYLEKKTGQNVDFQKTARALHEL